MGYLDIKNREDIDNIIALTLSKYFTNEVTISNKYSSDSFILNPRLNSAIIYRPSKKVIDAIKTGHAIRKNILKNAVAQFYIRFAFSRYNLFGCKYIIFKKPLCNAKDLYIMPGNMKIKIFDFKNMTIDNIIKNNYQLLPFTKEKKIREDPIYSFILPLKIISNNVYREQLLSGCTIDRLKSCKLKTIEQEIRKIIIKIQKINRKSINALEYSFFLKNVIIDLYPKLNNGEKYKKSIFDFINKVYSLVLPKLIDISFSHGDLQNGNIFVTKANKIYVLDWESCDDRSIGYDILTYYFKFRYRKNYILRIDEFLKSAMWEEIKNDFYYHITDKKQVLAIYVLEDILWIINENINTSEKRVSDSLKLYSNSRIQENILNRLI